MTTTVPPSDAVLAPGSLILITGVNGYIGCKVADELLRFGYRVRGAVRDLPKSAWTQEHFDRVYGSNKFELVEVKDMKAPGALDQAVKGCSGFAHFVSNVSWHPDPNIVINDSIAFVTGALDSAAKEPSLKRFVFTSTAMSATKITFNEVYDVTQDSWNTAAVERAWAPPPYTPERSLDVYVASKVQTEKALWEYMSTKKPHFDANTVLPDFLTGVSVNTKKHGMGPTEQFLRAFWNGNEMFKYMTPQYMIDAKDNALLHVGALLHPNYKGQRIFGSVHRKNWTDWGQRLKKMYPDHTFPDPPENEGWELTNVVDVPKAEALIKWLGQPGWRPMEESMKEAFDVIRDSS